MVCSKCSAEAVVMQPYAGRALCMRHLIADIETRAKKEIRKKGGLASGERIFIRETDDYQSFALRVFVSGLFCKRSDIMFTADERESTTLFSADTLDDTACALFSAVVAGTQISYLERRDKRCISPFSAIPAHEIYLYAETHGWKKMPEDKTTPVTGFLTGFSRDRPGSMYALKNIADHLEEIEHDNL